MFSHLGPVENGLQEYLYDVSADQFKFIHDTGIFKYDNFDTIANIKINKTKTVGTTSQENRREILFRRHLRG